MLAVGHWLINSVENHGLHLLRYAHPALATSPEPGGRAGLHVWMIARAAAALSHASVLSVAGTGKNVRCAGSHCCCLMFTIH